jgi:hypothetical protein
MNRICTDIDTDCKRGLACGKYIKIKGKHWNSDPWEVIVDKKDAKNWKPN